MNRCQLLKSVADEVGPGWTGVELGTATGYFANEILASTTGGCLWTVDRWAGRGKGKDKHDLAECIQAVSFLTERWGSRVRIVRASFEPFMECFPNGAFDFVYVDGYAHAGNGGPGLLRQAYDLVRPGGVFAVHDFCEAWKANMQSVMEFAGTLEVVGNLTEGDKFPSWWIRKEVPCSKRV